MKLKILSITFLFDCCQIVFLIDYYYRNTHNVKFPYQNLCEAIEELATHLADFSINEQNNSILLRYLSFGLYRLKSYRVRFEQEKNILFVSN